MIKFRIAALFSLLTGLALIFFMFFVYYYTRVNREERFFADLLAKARLEGQYIQEEDELAAEIYGEIINEHFNKLPEEHEYIVPLEDTSRAMEDGLLTRELLNETLQQKSAQYHAGGKQWVSVYFEDQQGDFIILVSAVDTAGQRELKTLMKNMVSGLLITIFILFAVGWAFAKTLTYPLIRISSQLRKINASDLSSRATARNKNDELGQLVSRLNEMLDRLEMGFEMQKKFISHASHELKTPLTVIMGESEIVLRKHRPPEAYINALQTIRSEGEKLTEILKDLIQLTEVSSGGSQYFEKSWFRIEDLILDVQSELFHYTGKNLIDVTYQHVDPADNYELSGNRRWLGIAFSNVVKNAFKFSDYKQVSVSTTSVMLKDNSPAIRVDISDQGIGIPAGELASVRNPFFRASNVGHIAGYGIGLSIVDQIIKLHGGYMKIDSKLNKGTTISLVLPLNKNHF